MAAAPAAQREQVWLCPKMANPAHPLVHADHLSTLRQPAHLSVDRTLGDHHRLVSVQPKLCLPLARSLERLYHVAGSTQPAARRLRRWRQGPGPDSGNGAARRGRHDGVPAEEGELDEITVQGEQTARRDWQAAARMRQASRRVLARTEHAQRCCRARCLPRLCCPSVDAATWQICLCRSSRLSIACSFGHPWRPSAPLPPAGALASSSATLCPLQVRWQAALPPSHQAARAAPPPATREPCAMQHPRAPTPPRPQSLQTARVPLAHLPGHRVWAAGWTASGPRAYGRAAHGASSHCALAASHCASACSAADCATSGFTSSNRLMTRRYCTSQWQVHLPMAGAVAVRHEPLATAAAAGSAERGTGWLAGCRLKRSGQPTRPSAGPLCGRCSQSMRPAGSPASGPHSLARKVSPAAHARSYPSPAAPSADSRCRSPSWSEGEGSWLYLQRALCAARSRSSSFTARRR